MAVSAYSIASTVLVVLGTWFLSRSVFKASVQRTVNYKMGKLPWLLGSFVFLSGYAKQYKNGELWNSANYPSSDESSLCTQIKIIEPLLGFVFIVAGCVLQLFA